MKHQCPSCGTEYEGNFCPNCGFKWMEEKTCPQCGATVRGSAKFCNNCGHAFVAAPSAPRSVPAAHTKQKATPTVKSVYSVLQDVPAFLFLVFSAALFLFYLAPVAISPSLFGEPADSFGNVYQCLKGIELSLGGGLGDIHADSPALRGAMIAFIVFAVVMTGFGAIWAISWWRRSAVWAMIGGLLQTILLVLSAACMGTVNAQGMGIVVAGAALQLILAFSVIYVVAEAAAIVAVRVLYRRFGGLEPPERLTQKPLPCFFFDIVRILPVLLFSVFSAALFLLYLCPTAQLEGIDFGSVYSLLKDQTFSPLMHMSMTRGLCIALLSLAVCMTLLAARSYRSVPATGKRIAVSTKSGER